MALTIIKQPDVLKPAMVRNPLEVALETDNYIIAIGQKNIIDFLLINWQQYDEDGNTIDVVIDGTTITHTFRDAPVTATELPILTDFTEAAMDAYAAILIGILNAEATINAKYVVTALPSYEVEGGLEDNSYIIKLRFTSVAQEVIDADITPTIVFTVTKTIIQPGIVPEDITRPTEIKLTVALDAYGNPEDGDTFLMEFDNIEYEFIFKSTPDDSGYQLPLRGALSLAAYQVLLLAALRGAPCFLDTWTITGAIVSDNIEFTITSIGYIAGDVLAVPNPARYVFDISDGYEAIYQENFTTNLHLFCEENYLEADFVKLTEYYSYPKNEPEGEDNHFISRFPGINEPLYDFLAKIYKENLSEALPYVANYPIAKHLLKQFYFKYFEAYGSPAANKIIKSSDTYIAALYGAGHLAFVNRKSLDVFGWLHPSGRSDNPLELVQYIDKDQPVWLYYFINPNDDNGIDPTTSSIILIIYLSDGTTAAIDITYGPAVDGEVNKTKTFFMDASYGYLQPIWESYETPDIKVFKYDIIIIIGDNFVTATKTFIVDCCSSYKSFLMYRNSYGGFDTLMIAAPKEYSLELTEGKEVERILGDNYSKHDSQYQATIPKARQNIKCYTGFKKASEVDVLKELLISDMVFVVPKNTTDVFIPVNLDRKTIQIESEDEYERTFAIEFSPAHDFKNFEQNIWLK